MILKLVYDYIDENHKSANLEMFYESEYFEFHDEMEAFYAVDAKGNKIILGDRNNGNLMIMDIYLMNKEGKTIEKIM